MTTIHHMPQCLIEVTHTAYNSLHTMMEDIGFSLKKAGFGITHYLFHPDMATDLYTFLVKELAAFDAPKVLFDINGKTNPALRATPDGSHLLDLLGIQQITFVIDNPSQHYENLKHGSDNGILLYLDKDFGPLIDRLNLPYAKKVFFPHGGCDVLTPSAPLPDRPHDILFAGNIFHPPAFKDWLAEIGVKDDAVARALENAAEQVLQESKPVNESFTAAFEAEGIELEFLLMLNIQTRLENYIAGKFRWDVIYGLKDTQLTVCGEIHPDAKLPNGRLNVVGPTLFRDILNQMTNSKFVLSLNPNYRNGGHERVFYGMNRGTVVISSHSHYLQPYADQDLGICLLPNKLDHLDEWFADHLSRVPEFEERRPAVLDHFLENHSWSKRLEPVLEIAGLSKYQP